MNRANVISSLFLSGSLLLGCSAGSNNNQEQLSGSEELDIPVTGSAEPVSVTTPEPSSESVHSGSESTDNIENAQNISTSAEPDESAVIDEFDVNQPVVVVSPDPVDVDVYTEHTWTVRNTFSAYFTLGLHEGTKSVSVSASASYGSYEIRDDAPIYIEPTLPEEYCVATKQVGLTRSSFTVPGLPEPPAMIDGSDTFSYFREVESNSIDLGDSVIIMSGADTYTMSAPRVDYEGVAPDNYFYSASASSLVYHPQFTEGAYPIPSGPYTINHSNKDIFDFSIYSVPDIGEFEVYSPLPTDRWKLGDAFSWTPSSHPDSKMIINVRTDRVLDGTFKLGMIQCFVNDDGHYQIPDEIDESYFEQEFLATDVGLTRTINSAYQYGDGDVSIGVSKSKTIYRNKKIE